MLALASAAPGRCEDVAPPPPLLVPEDTAAPAVAAPAVAVPAVSAGTVSRPRPLPETKEVEETRVAPALGGALAGALGGVVGAGAGAALLFWGALTPDVPEVALLAAAVATPAVAAFFGGSSVLVFAVDSPTAEDWGSVAGCTALGCLGVLAAFSGGGGLSLGTGCGSCGDPFYGARGSTHAALWGTAGSGLGAAIGLAVGAVTGAVFIEGEPSGTVNGPATVAVSAGIGGILGAAAGGALGGAIGGEIEDERAEARPRYPR